MDLPRIGTPLGTLIITCCLWIWTLRTGKAHIFQQEVQLRDKNRCANLAFLACFTLECLTLATKINDWVVGALCFLVFIAFSITSNQSSEGFWRKRSNVLFASTLGLLAFAVAPKVFTELHFVPLLCSFLIAHVAYQSLLSTFSSNLEDLKSLQSKLEKIDAERQNQSILESHPIPKMHNRA